MLSRMGGARARGACAGARAGERAAAASADAAAAAAPARSAPKSGLPAAAGRPADRATAAPPPGAAPWLAAPRAALARRCDGLSASTGSLGGSCAGSRNPGLPAAASVAAAAATDCSSGPRTLPSQALGPASTGLCALRLGAGAAHPSCPAAPAASSAGSPAGAAARGAGAGASVVAPPASPPAPGRAAGSSGSGPSASQAASGGGERALRAGRRSPARSSSSSSPAPAHRASRSLSVGDSCARPTPRVCLLCASGPALGGMCFINLCLQVPGDWAERPANARAAIALQQSAAGGPRRACGGCVERLCDREALAPRVPAARGSRGRNCADQGRQAGADQRRW